MTLTKIVYTLARGTLDVEALGFSLPSLPSLYGNPALDSSVVFSGYSANKTDRYDIRVTEILLN